MISMGSARVARAIFALMVAVAIAGMWSVSLATGAMPELATAPWTALMHLAAEFLTAATLAVGAWGLLRRTSWGPAVHLVGIGMVIYAVVQASGYFMQTGEPALSLMFGALFLMALADVWLSLRRPATAVAAPLAAAPQR
jgi:hypothetical protein